MLTDQLFEYLSNLNHRHSNINEIWVIGSRANGTATDESDWDFIVFGNIALFNSIELDTEIHRDDIDLLIVNEETSNFEKPWGSKKRGSLDEWRWKKFSETEAGYVGRKWIEDDEGVSDMGTLIEKELKAYRIWPTGKIS